MSTIYHFFTEARYQEKWYNIDYQTIGADGRLRHQFPTSLSRSFLGRLSDLVRGAVPVRFEDLAENTQQILLRDASPEKEAYVRKEHYFHLCDLAALEALATAPYENEYYLTHNQIALLERGEADDVEDYLTAKELLCLPEKARREYVLYRWDESLGNREAIQKMVDTLHDQLACFNRSLAFSSQMKPIAVRVLYRIS